MSILRYLRRPPRPTGDRATEDDVYYAYRLLLRRDPDPAGLAHNLLLIAKGITLENLIRWFVNSDEFRLMRHEETQPRAVDLGGYSVCIQKLDTDFGPGILQGRKYEEHVRQAVRESLRAGDVAVDIGANIGVIAFLAASLVGASGRVIAVEPNPDNLQLLYRGIVLNGFDNVEVLPYAASDARSVLSLTGGTSNTHVIDARKPEEGGHFVQSVVLDEALGDLPRLDFVKMDIEGHEPPAFEGFARMIGRHRPVLLTEFNPRCLADVQRRDPRAYLDRIFTFYPRVRVTSAFDDDETLDSAAKVMAHWERRNREITGRGLLPDRMLHFDLVTERQDG